MSNLRRVSTSKLLVLCATVLAVLVVGVAIANAIATSGSPPPRTSLPRAIRGALTAKAPVGISARIKFTSKLVDSSLLGEHASPLLTGATGRLWVAQGGRLRLELQSERGDTQIVSDGHRFLFSDPSSNTLYTGALPAHRQKREKRAEHKPSLAEIQISALPVRSELKAIFFPSGEKSISNWVRVEEINLVGALRGPDQFGPAVRQTFKFTLLRR